MPQDSIEQTYLDYLERSRQFSDELAETQRLVETGQFTGEDTGVGVPELQPSPLSKGSPVGTFGPPTKVPPLPTNLKELKTFTGFDDPGFLESLFGATGKTATVVDTTLKAVNAPFEALYNLIQQIPVETEGAQAARESIARLAYIGSLLAVPGDLGVLKGVKELNRAARGAKLAEQVTTRAAEIAGGKIAPAEFAGIQKGVGEIKDFPLFNLLEDIPGHPKGSTVSADTLKEAGFSVPTIPESVGAAAASTTAPASKTIKFGRRQEGEGFRGFITRAGEQVEASPEGHKFTDVEPGALRFRALEEPDRRRIFFDIPQEITEQQFSEIMRTARDFPEIVLDTPRAPVLVTSLRELREVLTPRLGKAGTLELPSATLSRIAKTHAESGGSTTNLTTGSNLAGTEGFAVSTFKGQEKILDHPPTAADLRSYIDGLPAEIKSNPNLTLGTWESGGKHFLDVSQVESDLNKALELGRQNNQQAIFDLKNLKDIPVEGSAESVGAAASKLAPGGTVQMNRALARSAESLPSLKKATDFFHAGEFNRDWYKNAFDELKTHFGDKADLMARLIAVTSPRTDVKDNVNVALKIFNQVVGKDTSRWTTVKWQQVGRNAGVLYPTTFAGNIAAAVNGGELGGLKVQNFYKAITGDPNAVVVDSWMTRFYFGSERRPSSPGSGFGINESEYALIRGRILSGANALGVSPVEFQAAIWAAQKMIKDPLVIARLDKGVDPAEAIPKLADTIKKGIVEAEKKNLLSPKATAAMRATMGLAVAITMGFVPEEK